uniref:AAA+ ATPase domain-containing protein n=1 Tax=Ananas comosus var. bracteatus TaxID=296719 RepID=A0A6V7QHJ1_ANACO|nr:unnamed protein product [Ananas comosus var. bracteatus]
MSEAAAPTRWTFEDFKVLYNMRFGRKKETEEEAVGGSRSENSGGYANVSVNSNGIHKKPTDLAVYEQFEMQERRGEVRRGIISDQKEMRQKPMLPPFESAEMRTLAEALCRDIIRGSPDVKWESIKGLENAKRLLKEAVVMPIKYPKYFTGLLSPWKGILLFGPPGTGKTMLAKAVATECKTTFSIFQHLQLSVNGVVIQRSYQRGEAHSEHEASRRLKTELLVQMDGLTKTNELVFVLAATNLPWELDAAMLRRLEKRILVPLPEPEARFAIFEELLPLVPEEVEIPYNVLVEKTGGYSGSDVRLLCKEAAMQPLRRLMALLEENQEPIQEDELPAVGSVTPEDIEVALRNTRPSAHLHAHQYDKFNEDCGSQILT